MLHCMGPGLHPCVAVEALSSTDTDGKMSSLAEPWRPVRSAGGNMFSGLDVGAQPAPSAASWASPSAPARQAANAPAGRMASGPGASMGAGGGGDLFSGLHLGDLAAAPLATGGRQQPLDLAGGGGGSAATQGRHPVQAGQLEERDGLLASDHSKEGLRCAARMSFHSSSIFPRKEGGGIATTRGGLQGVQCMPDIGWWQVSARGRHLGAPLTGLQSACQHC